MGLKDFFMGGGGQPDWSKFPVERKRNAYGYYYILCIEVNGNRYEIVHDTDMQVRCLSGVSVNGRALSGRDKKPALFIVAEYLGIKVDPKWSPYKVGMEIVMPLWHAQNEK